VKKSQQVLPPPERARVSTVLSTDRKGNCRFSGVMTMRNHKGYWREDKPEPKGYAERLYECVTVEAVGRGQGGGKGYNSPHRGIVLDGQVNQPPLSLKIVK